MAAISGNYWTLAIGKQSAKGVAQTTPTFKLKTTGGDIGPQRQVIQLSETDSSRQQGKSMVVGSHVQGSPQFYARPDDLGLLAYGALGTNADSGTASNYIHMATPLNSGNIPYFTIYKAIGGSVLVDRYVDCRITALRFTGSAGGALQVSVDIYGLTALHGQTDPVLTVVTQDPLIYPQVTCQLAGVVPATVESFEVAVNNNGEGIQADTSLTPYDYVPGELEVSGSVTLLFESDARYRTFHTGSTTGTTQATTLYSELLKITAAVTANLGVDFLMNSVAYTDVPVPPDPGGRPIRTVLGFRAMPDATIANYLQITTRNTVASY